MDRSIIDGIIIINLEFRKDKLEKCFEILEEVGMERESVYVLEATYVPTNGAKGCSHSHYRAIKYAKSMNWKNVLILEDDFDFNVPIDVFNSSLNKIVNSVKHWDVIMFEWGLNGWWKRSSDVLECDIIRKITHKKKGAWRTVAYFVNSSIYDKLENNFFRSYKRQRLLKEISSMELVLDRLWQPLQPQHEWFICIPKLMHYRYYEKSDIR